MDVSEEIPTRIRNVVINSGRTLDEFRHMSDSELLRCEGFGNKSLKWLRRNYPPDSVTGLEAFSDEMLLSELRRRDWLRRR